MENVRILLRPYTAIAIMCYLRETINDSNRDVPMLQAIHESVDEYERQIYSNITTDQLSDAMLENEVNYLTNRQPGRNESKS